MRRRLAFVCLGLWVCPAAAAPATTTKAETAHDVVAAIYAREIADEKAASGRTAFTDRKLRAKYFSRGFDRLIMREEARATRENSVGALDFDPIISGQDGAVTKLTVEADKVVGDRAVVSAHFTSLGHPTVVTYELVKENGAWAVDDIKGTVDKDKWSIRDLLRSAEHAK